MNARNANRLFATIVGCEAVLIAALFFVRNLQLPLWLNITASQLVVIIPTVLFLIGTKTKIRELIPIKKIRLSNVLLLIIVSFLFMPILTLFNAISLLFVENESIAIMGVLQNIPPLIMVLYVGVLAPMIEEFTFRGVFYHSYRKTGRLFFATILSSVLFGIMHLNFNQMGYAIVMGILGVLMVEATGSIWASIIFHVAINSSSAIMSIIQGNITGNEEVNASMEMVAGVNYKEMLLLMISVYMIIGAITTVLGICLLVVVARRENQTKKIQALLHILKLPIKESLITIPLVIALLVCIAYMLLTVFIMH